MSVKVGCATDVPVLSKIVVTLDHKMLNCLSALYGLSTVVLSINK